MNIQTNKLKIHVGCGRKFYDGWFNCDKNLLDISNYESWISNNIAENSVQRILAEHVFEHLSNEDRHKTIKNFYYFLGNNGFARIAVPDGFHPDKEYIQQVDVGGTGKSAYDHKFLYNYKTLTELFISYGFTCNLLEFFDESHIFHQKEWSSDDGFIKRSKNFDRRNKKNQLKYTSLIIDFYKS